MKISIVIPVFNSEEALVPLVEGLTRTLSGYEYGIVLVNDGSRDQSIHVCKQIALVYSGVTVINLSKNFGQHNAIMAGLKFASGDWVVLMDDDLQHPPSEIIKLITETNKGYDVVYGRYRQKKHSWFRNAGSNFNDLMATLLIKKPQKLYFGSFKIIHKYVVQEILKYNSAYPYIDGLVFRTTQNIGSVEVEHHERILGKSNYTFGKLVRLWLNMFTNFSILPLRVATLVGFGISGISFLIGLAAIILKLSYDLTPPGWASLTVGLTWLGGVQLACIGLLGEYVGRIYLCSNQTPQYVIKEIFTHDMEILPGMSKKNLDAATRKN